MALLLPPMSIYLGIQHKMMFLFYNIVNPVQQPGIYRICYFFLFLINMSNKKKLFDLLVNVISNTKLIAKTSALKMYALIGSHLVIRDDSTTHFVITL